MYTTWLSDKEYVAHMWNGILFRWEDKWDLNFTGEWTQLEYIVLIDTTQVQRKVPQVLSHLWV